MSTSIFKKPQTRADQGRNGFDLSMRRMFTAPAAMLLPVYNDFAYAGEKYRLNSSLFVRTEALQTAAMMRLKAHVEWFFVPMQQMFSLWNEFFNSTQDVESSIFDLSRIKNGVTLPYINFSKFFQDNMQINNMSFLFPPVSADNSALKVHVDEFGLPYIWHFRRLLDMFGYGSATTNYYSGTEEELNLCIWPYLAYHKIFYSHYNLTDWFENKPYMYNVDKHYVSGLIPHTDEVQQIMSTIHYRPYKKDYFTNVFPQPIFSNSFASAINSSLINGTKSLRSAVNPEGVGLRGGILNSLAMVNPGGKLGDKDAYSAQTQLYADANLHTITAADIRATFALDRLLRATAFAGGHYEDQTLAHFGYKVPRGISKEAYFIGSQLTDISINEVVASASTGATEDGEPLAGSSIGDIAGKGFGKTSGQKDLEFTAPCEGVLMAVFSIEPLVDYASRACETRLRYRDMLDFYHPELDNVGMQPMFGHFMYTDPTPNRDTLTGWTYRYSELKSRVDIVNEGFWDTSKSDWIGTKQSAYPASDADEGRPTVTNHWNFYCFPQYTNDIFLLGVPSWSSDPLVKNPTNGDGSKDKPIWDGTGKDWTNWPFLQSNYVYSSDNFLVAADFKVYKTSIMSVHSLPQF